MKEPEIMFEQLNEEATAPIGKLLIKILDDGRVPQEVRLEYYKEFVELLAAPKFIIKFDERENGGNPALKVRTNKILSKIGYSG